MISPQEYATKQGVSVQRIHQLLQAGRIAGAQYFPSKAGRGRWGIPDKAEITKPLKPWEK